MGALVADLRDCSCGREPPGRSPHTLQCPLQPGPAPSAPHSTQTSVHCCLTDLTFFPLGTGSQAPGFPEVRVSGCLCLSGVGPVGH